MADFVAIGLRALAFAATLQAAGVAVFIIIFGRDLDRTRQRAERIGVWSALTAILLTLAHALIEPARLTGELSGMFDPSLHGMLLATDQGTATSIRLLGLALLLGGAGRRTEAGESIALTGAALAITSFAFTGHTAADSGRWLLAPLLLVHLLLVSFWFGALLPLGTAARGEAPAVAGNLVQRFSQSATLLVPLILVAGIALAATLLPDWRSLSTPYGLALLAKVTGFAFLMALAAANKWRLGPRLSRGDRRAAAALNRSVLAEWLLISVIVGLTAVMTALFSPQH